MPVFFDDKEEVLSIELTQYGKYLLSKGKLKPVYYSFFDDDVLYDSEYGGFPEGQKEAEKRIQHETPRFKTQYSFTHVDSKVTEYAQKYMVEGDHVLYQFEEVADQSFKDTHVLEHRLGSAGLLHEKSANWKINLDKLQLESTTNQMTSSLRDFDIPQIYLSGTTKYIIADANTDLSP